MLFSSQPKQKPTALKHTRQRFYIQYTCTCRANQNLSTLNFPALKHTRNWFNTLCTCGVSLSPSTSYFPAFKHTRNWFYYTAYTFVTCNNNQSQVTPLDNIPSIIPCEFISIYVITMATTEYQHTCRWPSIIVHFKACSNEVRKLNAQKMKLFWWNKSLFYDFWKIPSSQKNANQQQVHLRTEIGC